MPNDNPVNVKPPGGDIGGSALTDHGQALNQGFGATEKDLNRGHLSVPQPDKYSRDGPPMTPTEGGFLRRSTISDER